MCWRPLFTASIQSRNPGLSRNAVAPLPLPCTMVPAHLQDTISTFTGETDGREKQCSLYQLDVRSMACKQLSSAGPSRKTGCGMVTYGKTLVLFGGRGSPSGPTQPGAQWDGGCTNELHTFELEEGEGVQLEV